MRAFYCLTHQVRGQLTKWLMQTHLCSGAAEGLLCAQGGSQEEQGTQTGELRGSGRCWKPPKEPV